MYFKMALRNVKKSFKDYMIYFLTLTFAVCIFYSFNSITGQEAMLEINSSAHTAILLLEKMISGVSVFVSMILGGLILYGNNFLVKKRKKELGMYMTLGMPKRRISHILLLETLIIGGVALGAGLIIGIIMAQGLSFLVIQLFEFDLSAYSFVISLKAIGKTILYFGIIFILVMLFNQRSVSRYQLIDLLNANKKNEVIKEGNKFLTLGTFLIGIASIGIAYGIVRQTGLVLEDKRLWVAVGLGCVGTFIYFNSLAGFLVGLRESNKKIYFKGLNLFNLRQISSKLHTNVISMTMICLMLFLTITGLATGLGFKETLEQSLDTTTPFDASAMAYSDEEGTNKLIKENLEKLGVNFEEGESVEVHHEYNLGIKLRDVYNGEAINEGVLNIYAIPMNEYNALRKLSGRESIKLDEDKILITSNNNIFIKIAQEIINQKGAITIGDRVYSIENEEVLEESFATAGLSDNLITFIVPDEAVIGMPISATFMNINYGPNNRIASEDKFAEVFDAYRMREYKGKTMNYEETGFIVGRTREQVYKENQGMTVTVLFLGIYLGMVFLISSAAVLALQQLSEASDSLSRYESLSKIGVTKKMIHKSIFVQTLTYFMLPLSLALIHASVGISVINDFLAMYNKPDIILPTVITLLILITVYGGYFYTTYIGYKNIVDYKL
ncbi:MAG: ABC transporter permease [Cellulosilyticaceae bacterium]